MPITQRPRWVSRWFSSLAHPAGDRRVVLLLPLATLPVACLSDTGDDLRTSALELTGGVRDRGDPSVVLLLSWDSANPVGTLGTCTAEVVAPDVLLTAAHCLASNRQNHAAYLGDDGKDLGTPIDPGKPAVRAQLKMAKEHHAHPQYVTTQGYYDVGVVILEAPLVGVPLLPINRTTPTASLLGNVSIIGYGKTHDQDTSFAVTKYRADGLSARLDATHTMTVGDAVRHACVGDSGGPVLAEINGVATIIGTDSYSDETGDASRCRMPSHYQRVDPYLSFLDRYVPRAGTGGTGGGGLDAGADASSAGGDAGSDAGVDAGWMRDAGGTSDASARDAGTLGGSVGAAGGTDGGAGVFDAGPGASSGGSGGVGGATGGVDSSVRAGDAGAMSGGPWPDPDQDDGGDGCAIATQPARRSGLRALGFAALALAFAQRRRRRRATA